MRTAILAGMMLVAAGPALACRIVPAPGAPGDGASRRGRDRCHEADAGRDRPRHEAYKRQKAMDDVRPSECSDEDWMPDRTPKSRQDDGRGRCMTPNERVARDQYERTTRTVELEPERAAKGRRSGGKAAPPVHHLFTPSELGYAPQGPVSTDAERRRTGIGF
jgi:hypothetical protein